MRSRLSFAKIVAMTSLSVALFAVSCTPDTSNTNAGNTNAANRNGGATASSSGRPADAVAAPVPGFYQAGPTGNVSLRFATPTDGLSVDGNSVAPTFAITGYPIYKDSERNKGQHIHVILDNEPYEADYDPTKPFSPENAKFTNLSPGTHTLRAFPSREWHESIKQPDGAAFDMVAFNAGGQATITDINKNAPLLTYSRPKGDYKISDDPRGVMLDFYLRNVTLGENDHTVRYTLNGKPPVVLTKWEPVWWKWEDLPPGEYTVLLELLDSGNKPVPFKVGSLDYNRTERKFRVLAEGQQPGAADHHGNSNAPATGNANSANRNRNANTR
jgi:hypothetical protein